MRNKKVSQANKKVSQAGELELIKLIRAGNQVFDKALVGIGDDAAVVDWEKKYFLVITTDSFVENVHFSLAWAGFKEIGYRSLAATLSDLAAMAAEPVGFLVALGIPGDFEVGAIKKLYEGFFELSSEFQVELMGGDIVSSPFFFVNLTAFGRAEKKLLRRRSEARPGEVLLVSGNPGFSALGLEALKRIPPATQKSSPFIPFIEAHLKPRPRIKEAQLLASSGAKAMEDISDGLASEAIHLAEESGVGIEIFAEKLPLDSKFVRAAQALGLNPEDLILYGGEDFELVFTVPEDKKNFLIKRAREAGLKLKEVGRVVEGKRAWLVKGGERIPLKPGYEHFKVNK